MRKVPDGCAHLWLTKGRNERKTLNHWRCAINNNTFEERLTKVMDDAVEQSEQAVRDLSDEDRRWEEIEHTASIRVLEHFLSLTNNPKRAAEMKGDIEHHNRCLKSLARLK